LLIAIGNSDERDLAVEAERLLGDASPFVRGAAVWALSQLLRSEEFTALSSRFAPSETEASVRAEWISV
jgi:epoxyqueuosine reductase